MIIYLQDKDIILDLLVKLIHLMSFKIMCLFRQGQQKTGEGVGSFKTPDWNIPQMGRNGGIMMIIIWSLDDIQTVHNQKRL